MQIVYPLLSQEDAKIIERLSRHLQILADISQADIFIDCLNPDKRSALIVAHAQPQTASSLYNVSLVGQTIFAENEPGVLFSLLSGTPIIGSRGIYPREQVTMQQNVVPIKNPSGATIGVLIMEQDISEKVKQEKNVERLIETTEHLSETLLQMAMSESKVPSLMHEGILLFDYRRIITYANARAYELLGNIGYQTPLKGQLIDRFYFGKFAREKFEQNGGIISEEWQVGNVCLQVKAVALMRGQQAVGGILLLRDISDLKEKEKQLMIKSAVIKEIHHRVKNNLQTIASLLRLQMRRSRSAEIEKVFRESIARITSISIVHEILAQDGLDTVDCKEVLESIARGTVASMGKPGQQIEVELAGESLYLPSDKATSLALIVNELIQNCVNHAFSERERGRIEIRLHPRNHFVHLTVADDGVGFVQREKTGKGHLGLEIVKTLVVENLNGILEFHNNGRGTEVTITFPV
ncbi:sensor histidine kinase [Brevibacillus marinus]|uniref:sensor histidine kinase n=1 Tax=Brevibacillus marinus TaxID=2496837 RepID=UPI000F841E64|nr:histidine kinase N-terminal domain-containing protein [Brevibacillus marinus]